jgi:molybdopterin-guanine dinucleotide biosynthesis protein MobB
MKKTITTIAFVGRSGSGKTTLIEKLTDHFTSQGFRVGVIKHLRHEFDIDHPGKDTFRFRAAGASVVSIANESSIAIIAQNPRSLAPEEAAAELFEACDILFVEGNKEKNYIKIEVIREQNEPPLFQSGINGIIALASDKKIEADLPVFHRDDIEGIARFIEGVLSLNS